MQNNDKPEFFKCLTAAMKITGVREVDVDKDVLYFWFDIFSVYTIEAFKSAIRSAVEECSGRIDPSKVKKYLPCPLGHPTVEEAWNAAPKSDSESAYVTDEIMAAISAADDSLKRGDMVAARMCFKEVYERSVNASRIANQRARFWLTEGLGHCEGVREENRKKALTQAHAKGWISDNVYQTKMKAIENFENNVVRLEDLSKGLEERRLKATKEISKIRDMLKGV